MFLGRYLYHLYLLYLLIISILLFQFFYALTGPRHRQRFLCELHVQGYPYTAVGNSTTKKDAQLNAATDFLQYLIRKGEIDPNDAPKLSVSTLWNCMSCISIGIFISIILKN